MVTHEEGGGEADEGDGVYGVGSVNDDNFIGGYLVECGYQLYIY